MVEHGERSHRFRHRPSDPLAPQRQDSRHIRESLAGLQQFTNIQYERSAVALITLNESGMGVEAQLIPFDELGPVHDNQVVIGEVLGIYHGFWSNAGEGELGTHSIDGLSR